MKNAKRKRRTLVGKLQTEIHNLESERAALQASIERLQAQRRTIAGQVVALRTERYQLRELRDRTKRYMRTLRNHLNKAAL